MNAVTVALGSTLATVLLTRSVALVEGLVAFALLIGLQLVITWLSVRSERFQSWIKARPSLLMHRGRFIDAALREERVTREEVEAAIRAQGFIGVKAIDSVVLETDGSFSVLTRTPGDGTGALEGVSGFASERGNRRSGS
jgi:uncharacterized membrane protein YcaP (DUF421 family)